MPQFHTVKDAARIVGKSPSAIRRVIHPIARDDQHADRDQIRPTPEEVRELRARGANFPWQISDELLRLKFPKEGELASLTPRSFLLDAPQPTLTVQAGASKHRRKDVLPLHPTLVSLLREWTQGDPDAPLFPKLARRKTWLMVQKDLALAGIPYKTAEGIADFHAAGRHTHITELLRNGVTLPEAKELARHSDVKMTMRYTHIGMDDQAEALRLLPCQHIVSKSAGFGRLRLSVDDATVNPQNEGTPVGDGGCVVDCHPLAEGDRMEAAGFHGDCHKPCK